MKRVIERVARIRNLLVPVREMIENDDSQREAVADAHDALRAILRELDGLVEDHGPDDECLKHGIEFRRCGCPINI